MITDYVLTEADKEVLGKCLEAEEAYRDSEGKDLKDIQALRQKLSKANTFTEFSASELDTLSSEAQYAIHALTHMIEKNESPEQRESLSIARGMLFMLVIVMQANNETTTEDHNR